MKGRPECFLAPQGEIATQGRLRGGLNPKRSVCQRTGFAKTKRDRASRPEGAHPPCLHKGKLNNIALIHHSRGEYAEAVRLLREALEIDRRQGDSHGAAKWQLNLGFVLKDQGDLPGAKRELTAGLKAIQMVGDRDWEAAGFRRSC